MVTEPDHPIAANADAPEQHLSWWLSALQGQAQAGHPVYGETLHAELQDETLVMTGTVPSEDCRHAVQAELRTLQAHTDIPVRNELTVAEPTGEEPGVLQQTLVATYENATQAKVVAEQLRANPVLDSGRLQLLTPDSSIGDGDRTEAFRTVTETYRADLDRALEEGHAVLVVTVDETRTFEMRQLLDEETRSLQTLVLPPRVAGSGTNAVAPDTAERAR